MEAIERNRENERIREKSERERERGIERKRDGKTWSSMSSADQPGDVMV